MQHRVCGQLKCVFGADGGSGRAGRHAAAVPAGIVDCQRHPLGPRAPHKPWDVYADHGSHTLQSFAWHSTDCRVTGAETDAVSCELANCCWNATGATDGPPCFLNDISDTQLYELNARAQVGRVMCSGCHHFMQVTLWGPQNSTLTDYAYKLWSGLIIDYYYPRWSQWTAAVTAALQGGQDFNQTAFLATLQAWEEGWVHRQGNPYPQTPSGDAFTLASSIYDKYFA